MTEIVAVVRRSKAVDTRKELERADAPGWTSFPVLGRGRQRGLKTAAESAGVPFLAKVLFSIVVEDDQVDPIIEAITRANQTGEFGDGRIWTVDLGRVLRISEGGALP
jgi:nitrogen regulatory protein PII